jgi:hypothetical protein
MREPLLTDPVDEIEPEVKPRQMREKHAESGNRTQHI